MIERAVDVGVPFGWVSADEANRQNPGLRGRPEARDIAYVMATRRDHEVPSGRATMTRVDQVTLTVLQSWTQRTAAPPHLADGPATCAQRPTSDRRRSGGHAA